MISEQEQAQVRLLSDNELYPQAIEFMKGIGKPLPANQVNGLLNVSLGCTYGELKKFVDSQHQRKTWSPKDEHIREFYKRPVPKIKDLEKASLAIIKNRRENVSLEDKQAINMAVVREFIQHLLAENAYRSAMRAFDTAPSDQQRRDQRRPFNRGGQAR